VMTIYEWQRICWKCWTMGDLVCCEGGEMSAGCHHDNCTGPESIEFETDSDCSESTTKDYGTNER
jgi:hypothetical protein